MLDLMKGNSQVRLSTVPAKLLETASSSNESDTDKYPRSHSGGKSKVNTEEITQGCIKKKIEEFRLDMSAENESFPEMTKKEILKKEYVKENTISPEKESKKNERIDLLRKFSNEGGTANSKIYEKKRDLPKIKSIESYTYDTIKDKKTIESLKQEVQTLKKAKEDYKAKYIESQNKLNKLREVHDELEQALLENWKEKRDKIDKLLALPMVDQAPADNHQFAAIGAKRSTDGLVRYHIGRDVWIAERAFNAIFNSCRKPSVVAGSIITAVFDTKEIVEGTISGLTSKRKGHVVKCSKLDPSRMRACEEFFMYWMHNKYSPNEKESASFTCDLGKFQHYAGKKIAEVKRVALEEVPEKRKRKMSDTSAKKTKYRRIIDSDDEGDEQKFNDNAEPLSEITNTAVNDEDSRLSWLSVESDNNSFM